MSDEKIVSFGRRVPDPARVRDFAATARKLQQERTASGDLVDNLLATLHRDQWHRMTETVALRTTGAVDRLNKEVHDRLERDPQAALAIAEVATQIADQLPNGDYPAVVLAQVRAAAWKCLGQALSYLGRQDEALAALQRAEETLLPLGTVAHDLAIVRLARALVVQHLGDFDQSVALLDGCKRVFYDHRDLTRYLDCGMCEGILLYRRGAYELALETWTPLLEAAHEVGNVVMIARIHNNLAHASLQLSELEQANVHLGHAIAGFTEAGKPIEAVRAHLGAGRLLISKGHYSQAETQLRDARRQFAEHGMREDALLASLDLAAALIGLGHIRDARALAREVTEECAAGAMSTRALEALAFLHAAFDEDTATPAIVRHVTEYLQRLRAEPALQFAMP